ncbi:MCE family protein [Actinomadura sp. HBU206391]|uniref:MCE family protein n=1 Tax=Actinomadura sp. HBU206391 TaxID=2731692 RepID=UPI0021C90095|nr:MCE family protein [Actinomadura sp. HBU206391]
MPMARPGRRLVAIAVAVVLVLATTALWRTLRDTGSKRITAYFEVAVGVYAGSDLRVLGVKVGRIDAVRPQGRQVEVTMTLDRGVAVPAGAGAVVVAPSVVADRYIQLAPAYTGGPRIADGAVIPAGRTATPVELDQLYASISRLTTALGPNGVNSGGALSDVLETGAANLDGNGRAMGDMIRQFGSATRTLSGSSDDLFATVRNLQKFTTMLKNNDGQVRQAERQLAQVTGFLADDRHDLGAALRELSLALGELQRFVQGNRSLIKANVDRLASVTQVLVDQRASLAEALDVAPLAAGNVLNAYNPANQTLDGRGDLNELSMGPRASSSAAPPRGPAGSPSLGGQASDGSICAAADAAATRKARTGASRTGSAKSGTSGTEPSSPLSELCRRQVRLGNLVPIPPSELGSLPPLPLPPVGPVHGSPRGPRAGER